MNRQTDYYDEDARHRSLVRILVGSCWAPVLWLAVLALGDGSNLVDPPSEAYFRQLIWFPALSLFIAAAFVNISLWLAWRTFPGLARTLWILSVGISGLILFVIGLWSVSCEPNDYFSCSGYPEITRLAWFVCGVMAFFTLPGWIALGFSRLKAQSG